LFAEKSFLILALAFTALTLYGLWSGASWIAEKNRLNRAILEKQETNIATKREKTARGYKGSTEPGNYEPDPSNPYTIGMELQTAVLPFAASSVFSVGQADVLPSEAGVTVSTLQRTKADKSGFENPLSFLAGRFDLSFVVVYLLPLFILALSFNVISGERESGVLQMLMAQPLKLAKFVAAKIGAHFALILGIALLVSLVGVLLWAGETPTDFWMRAGLWILLIAGYAAFWFALSTFINSFGFSSATNAVVAAAAWLILVLILPSLLNVFITLAYPVPSRNELVSAVRSVNLDMRRDGKRLLAEHYQDHPELMPKDGEKAFEDFGLAFVHIQREQKKRTEEVEDRFAAQLAAQQSLVKTLRFLSPSVVAQEASNDIAGTGIERYQHFRTQVKELDAAWSDYFVPKIYRMESLTAADFDRIPRFRFQEESIGVVASRVIPGVLFLFATTAALIFASFGKLRKYEIEK